LAGEDVSVTTGAVPAGGTTMGTMTVAGADTGTVPFPPTTNWKVRFCDAATVGATKVALADVAF
jgi:hypothetical protein